MSTDPRRIKDLFGAALDLPDPASRQALLDRECGEDPELRRRVEVLLAAHDAPHAALGQPLAGPPQFTGAYLSPAEEIGTTIAGKYKLLQAIGEGGMGSVFMADQTEPVKRRVALKLIRAGMDSRTVLARFEAERQALALMDHPNIAKVLDAGTTESQHPYFVMELVKGVPVNQFCDEHKLSITERLHLFTQVCSAVQHAHQKGIIHRDLKPSNVLVESHDGKPVPKVIDFGLAKAMSGQPLTENTLFTALGSVAGTPLYMAPEQAAFNAIDVDTRADIYALGVILYELLTGTTPIERATLKKAAFDEILRVIRESEPPTPSKRLTATESKPSVAACRQMEPAKLGRFLRGDLDWIVMKALAKERDRRYETAIGFAKDIERFLNQEPVVAGPPTATYRLRKFAFKHRVELTTAAVIAALLVTGIVGTTVGLFRARAAEREALQAQKSEAERAEGERKANVQAQKRLTQIQNGNEIITSIFADLDMIELRLGIEPLEAVLAKRLVKAAGQLEGEAVGDPLVVAGLQNRLGLSLHNLGHSQDAIPLFGKAREIFASQLAADDPRTLECMNDLAEAYRVAGKLDLVVPLHEETLKLRKAKLGADHPDTLESMNNLAAGYWTAGKLDLALTLWEETLKLRKAKLGADDPHTLTSMNDLAAGYWKAGKLDLAVPLWEETLKLRKTKLGADHPYTLQSMNNLAEGYRAAGKLDLAVPLFEETLKLRKAKLGADHPETLLSMDSLASGYADTGKLELALPLHEETLKLRKAKLGADHPETFTSMHNLASAYHAAGKLDLALLLCQETLKLTKAKFGADHLETLACMNNLAEVYHDAGKMDLALPLHEETLRLAKAKLGANHPHTLATMGNLASAYHDAKKLDLALPLHEETLKLMKANLGADHPHTLAAMQNLAVAYQDAGKLDLALPFFEEAAAGIEKRQFQHGNAGQFVNNLCNCYEQMKRFPEAETWRRKWLAVLKEQGKSLSPAYAGALATLGLDLLEQSKWSDADVVLRDCVALREKLEPDAWTTFNAKSLLGAALLGQKKYADAEPLLLAGYEGMKQRENKIPKEAKLRLAQALERLVRLYESSGKPEEAAKWQKELEALNAAEKLLAKP